MGKTIFYRDATGSVLEVPRHCEGGVLEMDGIASAEVHVTGNYLTIWNLYFEPNYCDPYGIWGKNGSDLQPTLERGVTELGTTKDTDFWEPTHGNVGAIFQLLLEWIVQHPNGRFEYV